MPKAKINVSPFNHGIPIPKGEVPDQVYNEDTKYYRDPIDGAIVDDRPSNNQ
jgi:hypothetical protein